MKKLFLHIKRLFRKFWFVIFFAFAVSLVHGLIALVVMTIISMLFFDNIVDVDAILENFTDEQLEIILSEEMDENVSDDDYLTLLARYQSFFCPKKIDRGTIWTCSMVTNDAYIYSYELKGNEPISVEELKKKIFAQINTNGVHVKRLVNSNRQLVFRYTYRQTGEAVEIVFTTDDLRG
jgi:hypothetical protein